MWWVPRPKPAMVSSQGRLWGRFTHPTPLGSCAASLRVANVTHPFGERGSFGTWQLVIGISGCRRRVL
ncbi:MAG: hypothetical protein HY673_23725 [Chloroflexi bacterium]|nr:hypothetical protein [Chloroflexota bacterium]